MLVDITKNAQFDELDFEYTPCKGVRSYVPVPKPDLNAIECSCSYDQCCPKPFIVFGQGVILGNAEEELKALIEKSGIPAAWTILGLSALDSEHP